MDHTCVCENGDGKACYRRNGHFKGTLVRTFYIYMKVYILNIFKWHIIHFLNLSIYLFQFLLLFVRVFMWLRSVV